LIFLLLQKIFCIFAENSEIMKKLLFLFSIVLLTSCATHYRMVGIDRSRILIDKRYDASPSSEAQTFLAPYKHEVDSIMSPVVGKVARYMSATKPESDLSNLLCDILVWAGSSYGEKPDFSVYNMGGIRAALAEGEVTYGDVLDVAPFENKICFLTLTGEKTLELFSQIASRGGEGVSHGVEMRIADGKLLSVKLHGKEIDPKGSYRVSTLDYLAQGNDGLLAFKDGTNVVSPKDEKSNVRFIIMNYFRSEAAEGRVVDAQMEGRIVSEDVKGEVPVEE